MEAAHRSILPDIPGVPWYAALLIAVTATAIGYGIDAGHKELTHVFAGFYIAGCVIGVLAVRQDGLFTAIIQPPLILFCAVPGAYWMFHGGKMGHLKDLLIDCGYPLIERFPLMLGTAGGVLLIGLARWYFGKAQPPTPTDTSGDTTAAGTGEKSVAGTIIAKLQAMLRPDSTGDPDEAPAAETRRSRTAGSSPRGRRTSRSGRSGTRSTRTHSRHGRQQRDDGQEPVERPRRSSRRNAAAARDYDSAEPPRRSRRRTRPETDPDLRSQSPREAGRESRTRRSPYERPGPRSSRFDGSGGYGDTYDPPASPQPFGRYEASERYDRYEPLYEPRRRRPSNGASPTHHPISQVRYRGTAAPEEPGAEPRPERHSRSRSAGRSQGRPLAESWEDDV